MPTPSTQEERTAAAADPMTVTIRLKRPAYCPACGMGLQPFNVCFISGYAFCKDCGPDLTFVTQAAIKHMQTHVLAPFVVWTHGLVWFTSPAEHLRGNTIFTLLDQVLHDTSPPPGNSP